MNGLAPLQAFKKGLHYHVKGLHYHVLRKGKAVENAA